LFSFWWDKKRHLVHSFTNFWSYILLVVNPFWKINIEGKDKIDRTKKYVIVSNHQSEFDIPLIAFLNMDFKWVSKAEIFKIPIIGLNMWLNDYIKLVRGNKNSIIKMIKDCGIAIKNGNSIYIFPEGTRSETGKLREFMTGAFVIAKREKIGVLPIVINGTKNIMPKGSLKLNYKANISLKVLDEIPYDEVKDCTTEDIRDKVKSQIDNYLEIK
jgi:1-acyl-sn-glycerol-3-phosphate acyltransferase